MPLFLAILIFVFSCTKIIFANEWSNLRGPSYDGTSKGGNFAATDGKLSIAWKNTIGPGYSGVTIINGKAVTMFSDGAQDLVAGFDASTGKEIWRFKIADTYKGHDGSHDGPIATNVIADGRVFGMGASGHLFALDLNTGKLLWSANAAEMEGQPPFYGFGSSPLVVNGLLIVEIGAKEGKAITAFDVTNGKRKWTLGDDSVSYQTPIAIRFNEKEQIIAVGDKKLFGIDPSGKILWEYAHQGEDRAMAAACLVPVPSEDGKILLKNKLDESTLIRLVNGTDGKINVETVWTAGVFKTTYSVPVYHDGYFYGYNGRILTCVDAANGELKWRSRAPGDGFAIIVNGYLVIQTKDGTLHIGKASPEGWVEKSMLELFPATSWTAPSFADGAVFARSQGEIARIEWQPQQSASTPIPVPTSPVSSGGFRKFLTQLDSVPDKKTAVDKYIASVKSFPLIEWPDQVHFLYRGDAADMGIAGDMIGSRKEEPMTRIPGTNLFYYSIRLEPDARLNYYFIKNYDQTIPDPLNPRLTHDFQSNPNSWISMPAWKAPSYLEDAPEEKRGRLESNELKSKLRPGGGVKYEVYLPAGYDSGSQRYPTIYLFDGPSAKSQGMIVNAFDNLMGATARPAIVVLMDELKTGENPLEDFEKEFEASALVLNQELVPLIDSKYRTITEPSSRAVVTCGIWAATALYAVFKKPDVFGAFGSQSAFLMREDEEPLMKTFRNSEDLPLRIYLDWGTYDLRAVREGWDMVKENRELNSHFRKKGYYPAGGEVHDGFGWTSWRNRTDRWLVSLFPIQ
jgi:outer membrane protein assembly factor BamB/enterochelin esterase-like enzyme